MSGDGTGPRASAGRWEHLFADLEAQLAAARGDEVRWDVADLTRAERARVPLADRLRAAVGTRLRVVTAPGEHVEGVVTEATGQWLLLDLGAGRRALVPTAAVRTVEGLGAHAAPPAGRVESGLGLGHALRALARDRVVVAVSSDVGTLSGRLDRVGADHVDLVLDAPVRRVVTVPFDALRAVVSR